MAAELDNPNKRKRQASPPPPPPPPPAPVLSSQAVAAAAAAEAALRILEREAAAASAALVAALSAAGADDDEEAEELWVEQVDVLESLLLDLRQHRAEAEAAPDDQVGWGGHGPAGSAAPTCAQGEAGVGVAVTVERMARAALNGDLGELILLSERRLRLLAYAAGSGFTPMTTAACGGFFEMTRFLLDAGVAVNQLDGSGASPLFHAALGRHQAIVKLLLLAGADPKAPGHVPTGANALHAAAAAGGLWAVQAMLEQEEDAGKQQGGEGGWAFVDRGDKSGRTAVWLAAAGGHTAVVDFLLRRGADPLIPDAAGRLPREAAAAAGHAGCVELLEGTEKRYRLLQARAFVSAELRAGHKPTTATTTTKVLPAWAQRRLAAGLPLPRVDVVAADADADAEGAVLDLVVRRLPSEIFVELVEAIGATFGPAARV